MLLQRMRVYLVLLLAVLVLPYRTQGDVCSTDADPQAREARPVSAPLFIENVGQFDKGARFQMWGGAGTTWLAEDGLWITLVESLPREGLDGSDGPRGVDVPMEEARDDGPTRAAHLKLSFVGANPQPRLEPYGRAETVVSYFIGADRDGWRADVPVWTGVRYVDLYPGVDLLVGADGEGQVDPSLPWRLVVRERVRGADALRDVRLRVEGAEEVAIEGDALRLTTALGEVRLSLPVRAGGGSPPRSPRIVDESAGEGSGTIVAAPFAAVTLGPIGEASLADDPTDLTYATFLGGSADDSGFRIAVDGAGCAYVTGRTRSSDFPGALGPGYDTDHNGDEDAYVIKLNAGGTALVYATFLGGSGWDDGRGVAVDGRGCAYVTGRTASSDFCAALGPGYDTDYNGGEEDAYLVNLSASGTALAYATFLGGSSYDRGFGIAVDGTGCAYATGMTGSSDFPAALGPGYDTDHNGGSYDAYVVKLDASGMALTYGTFLGGSSHDRGFGIAVDGTGCAYVTGYTTFSDFSAVLGPGYDTDYNGGSSDAYVVKLNAGGMALAYATFLGGSLGDWGLGIAVDGTGCAYVTGWTESSDFPANLGPGYNTDHNGGSHDAYAVKLNASGTALAYATFLGGSGLEDGQGIAVDGTGCAHVTGWTDSDDFFAGLWPGYDTSHNGGEDAYLVALNASGTALTYATFLGGSGADYGRGIAVDGAGCAYATGTTGSSDFVANPGPGYDTGHNGGDDAYVVKLWVAEGPFETDTPAPTPTDTTPPTPTRPTPTATEPPTPTPTPTETHTVAPTEPVTPTPTPTPTPLPTAAPSTLQVRYCSVPGDLVHRLDSVAFRPYAGDSAVDSALIEITSPPAPAGWNQPGFTPGAGWGPAVPVWWDHWETWTAWPYDCARIGLADGQGAYGVDGTTHLIRRTFDLTPPYAGWRIVDAQLAMWSDNKTAWWWQGERIATDREGLVGEMALYPGRVAAEGGRYLLAVQNSNDFVGHENPQGTAYRLTVTWEGVLPPLCLPLVLR